MDHLPIVLSLVGGLPDAWFTEPDPPARRGPGRGPTLGRRPARPAPARGRAARSATGRLGGRRSREALLDILGLRGAWPPSWPLRVRVKETLRRDGYTIEKLTYESWPGMAVPALLYVPERIPPEKAPGVVSISGHHYRASKAADYVQARNVNLVRRGCVVLSYDYMNCFERHTGGDGDGHDPAPHGGGNDHGITAFSFSERCPTALEILDARRALDVLAARPEVDAGRLGFTGESGGSNSTYWVAALDDRVKLSVPVCSVSTFDYWIDKDRNWDWHQRPPGARRVADIGVLLALHAPRPTLVITSKRRTDDLEFPWEEAERSYRWARRVYELYGAEDKIAHVESPTGHGYQADKRLELYAWVERELLRAPSGVEGDLPVTPEPLETLRVGLPEGNKTYHDVYREWVAAIPVPRPPGTREEVAAYAATDAPGAGEEARPAAPGRAPRPSGPSARPRRRRPRRVLRDRDRARHHRPRRPSSGPPGTGPLPVVLIVGERGPVARRGRVGPGRRAGRAGGRAARGRRGGLGRPPHRQRRLVLRPAPGRPGGVRRPPRGRPLEGPPRRRLDLPRRPVAAGARRRCSPPRSTRRSPPSPRACPRPTEPSSRPAGARPWPTCRACSPSATCPRSPASSPRARAPPRPGRGPLRLDPRRLPRPGLRRPHDPGGEVGLTPIAARRSGRSGGEP